MHGRHSATDTEMLLINVGDGPQMNSMEHDREHAVAATNDVRELDLARI